MRIAQVAPLYESVPPKRYGGTERVISYLTEELVARGMDVTLFASGDSRTRAELIPCCPKSIREFEQWMDPMAFHALQLDQVLRREFDVVHFHVEYLAFPFSRVVRSASVSTLHGPLPDIPELFETFRDVPLVAISESQRAAFADLNWRKTIYHGLPRDLYTFRADRGQYLAFVGRIAPEKRCDRAIEIAKRCGIRLKIAAKVDPYDQPYFEAKIKPLMADSLIEFVGEIGEREKNELLGNALALLFPIDWPEPFGLVLIESLACGTPVITYRNGAAPEIIEDGKTGFVVESVEAAVRAVDEIEGISRQTCRDVFESRFTASRMAEEYEWVYRDLASVKNSVTKKASVDA